MCFFLVEFNAEETSQVLKGLLLIGEHVISVNFLHVVVFIPNSGKHYFWMLLDVFAEGVVVGAFDDVDNFSNGCISLYWRGFMFSLTIVFVCDCI